MMHTENWFGLNNLESIPSPALVFYPERIKKNISTLIEMIDDVERLRPHVKTHKTLEITQLMLEAGIRKFKCATIAEAEMLALAKATDVLLAYQPVGPNILRLLTLMQRFPETRFSCLIDCANVAFELNNVAAEQNQVVDFFIDLNVGMNRTGISVEEASGLYAECLKLKNLNILGLHAYDGHIHDASLHLRQKKCDLVIQQLYGLQKHILDTWNHHLSIVAGGTPGFTIYAAEKDIECSPGTFVLWDKGYQDAFQEQNFLPAAVLITRIISLPEKNFICTDLGHKAIAAENDLNRRVFFLNDEGLKTVSQSEEHLVLRTGKDAVYKVGDVLYALPIHVCPTVALHEQALIAEAGAVVTTWDIVSRKRKITI